MQASAISEPQITELLSRIIAATHLDLEFTMQRHSGAAPNVTVEFTGPDTRYLTTRDAELLKALEHIAAKVSGLTPEQHDLLSFDAENYKRNRDQALLRSAHRAAATVRQTNLPFTFPPMSSHERRQLHLILNALGLHTASSGEGPTRAVKLYPAAPGAVNQHTPEPLLS